MRPLLLWVFPSRDHIRMNEGGGEIWLASRSGHLAFRSVVSLQLLLQPLPPESTQAAHGCTHLWFVCNSVISPLLLSWSPGTHPCIYIPRHHSESLLSVRDRCPSIGTCLTLSSPSFPRGLNLRSLLNVFSLGLVLPLPHISVALSWY